MKVKMCILLLFISVFVFASCVSIGESAEINSEGGFVLNGIEYVHVVAECGDTGRCIAKTTEGHKINEYKDDSSHTFLELRSFLDNNTVVRIDYIIPTEGEISCIYVSGERISDKELFNTISSITSYDFTESFFIETDNINFYAEKVFVGYEDCPVGTNVLGYIGCINDKWVFISNDTGESNVYECNIIPNQYIKKLNEYDIFPHREKDTLIKLH